MFSPAHDPRVPPHALLLSVIAIGRNVVNGEKGRRPAQDEERRLGGYFCLDHPKTRTVAKKGTRTRRMINGRRGCAVSTISGRNYSL